jgi:hypothetical protein
MPVGANLSFVITPGCDLQGVGTLTLQTIVDPDLSGPYVLLVNGTTYSNSFAVSDADLPYIVEDLPNDRYTVMVLSNTGPNKGTRTATVACTPVPASGGGSSCDLQIVSVTPTAPTAAGGFGFVTVVYSTSSHTPAYVQAVSRTNGGLYANSVADTTDDKTGVLYQLPVDNYTLVVGLPGTNCEARRDFAVPAFVPVPDPTPAEPARWEPVGGVLPNPVLLDIEAVLVDATRTPRAGLHVDIELWRPGAVATFVGFRATVRAAKQQVDAAPYLRAELLTQQRYAGTVATPFVDGDACLRYTYQYRIVDAASVGPWVVRLGPRYAVLAALPEAADTMAPYVADGTGQVASIFRSGEAVQFVGMPLEVSVLLPPPDGPRWAELRYLDAWGQAVEIRSLLLADTLPAGMLRIPLPNDPPLCATSVEVSVRDDDRHFASTCGHVIPAPLPSTSGTYADPIYGHY